MGFAEAAQKANEAWAAKFGIAAVYVPASGAPSFAVKLIPTRVEQDEFDERGETDQTTRSMLHSDLTAGGLTEPTIREGSTPGDVVIFADLNGVDREWVIVGRGHDGVGMWTLTLKRNRRVVP